VPKNENRESARESDTKPSGHSSGGELMSGGKSGVRFPCHDHPDKSVVTKGKLKE
jgi:hypothetical protein